MEREPDPDLLPLVCAGNNTASLLPAQALERRRRDEGALVTLDCSVKSDCLAAWIPPAMWEVLTWLSLDMPEGGAADRPWASLFNSYACVLFDIQVSSFKLILCITVCIVPLFSLPVFVVGVLWVSPVRRLFLYLARQEVCLN